MSVAGVDSWTEGRDGEVRRYRERLYPPVAVFILAAGLATMLGVAYGAAYGSALGWASGLLLGTLGFAALLATSTPIHVDDRVLRAGRARLPLTSVARATALDAEAMREARRHGDPRDYVVLRAWSSRRGVSVQLADARDPHPHWLVTSRHPERLAAAVNAGVPPAVPPTSHE